MTGTDSSDDPPSWITYSSAGYDCMRTLWIVRSRSRPCWYDGVTNAIEGVDLEETVLKYDAGRRSGRGACWRSVPIRGAAHRCARRPSWERALMGSRLIDRTPQDLERCVPS